MVQQQQIGRRIAEGREAEIFEYGDGAVLKLLRDERFAAGVELEAAAMRAVRAAGGPAPEPRGVVHEQGRAGLIIERVDGPDMLALLGKKPWYAFSAGGVLGATHAALHDVAGPAALPSVKDRYRMHIERTARDAPRFAALAEFVLSRLDAMPDGDRLCHGDYHPGNVLITSAGPRVIDWPNGMRGDPHADVARTLLLFDIATLPPGSPAIVRALERFARKLIRSRYLASYRRTRPLDDVLLARWRIVGAAERISHGIEDERDALLAILQTAMAQPDGSRGA